MKIYVIILLVGIWDRDLRPFHHHTSKLLRMVSALFSRASGIIMLRFTTPRKCGLSAPVGHKMVSLFPATLTPSHLHFFLSIHHPHVRTACLTIRPTKYFFRLFHSFSIFFSPLGSPRIYSLSLSVTFFPIFLFSFIFTLLTLCLRPFQILHPSHLMNNRPIERKYNP